MDTSRLTQMFSDANHKKILSNELQIPVSHGENLKMNFGTPISVPVETVDVPISPTTSMMQAGKYILEQQRKGFISSSIKFGDNPKDVYKQELIFKSTKPYMYHSKKRNQDSLQTSRIGDKTTSRPKQNEEVIFKRSKDENYFEFWLDLDCVVKTKDELSKLPFKRRIDMIDAMTKFMDQIATVLRVMKHENKLEDVYSKKKERANSIMHHFVTSVRNIRFNVISAHLQDNSLDYNLMKEKQKKEFFEFSPEQLELKAKNDKKSNEKTNITPFSQMNLDQNKEHFGKLDDDEKLLAKTSKGLPYLYCAKPNLSQYIQTKKQIQQNVKTTVHMIHDALVEASKASTPTAISRSPEQSVDNFTAHPIPPAKQRIQVLSTPVSRNGPKLQIHNIPTRRVSSRPRTRPKTSFKSTREQLSSRFWDEEDPLSTRSTHQDINRIFDKYTAPLEIEYNFDDFETEDPFKLESIELLNRKKEGEEKKKEKELELKRKQKEQAEADNAFDIRREQELDQERQLEELREKYKIDDVDFYELSSKNIHSATDVDAVQRYGTNDNDNRKNLQYLIKKTRQLTGDEGGDQMYNKLNEIWDTLGFSAVQKLQMASKYSESLEVSRRLEESLAFWQSAHEGVMAYLAIYKKAKDFIKNDIMFSKNKQADFDDILKELFNCETIIFEVAKRLNVSFGDDLIIHRKKANDAIASRRMKLKYLITNSEYPSLSMDNPYDDKKNNSFGDLD